MSTPASPIDLAAYLARIGLDRPARPDRESLAAVMAAHLSSIPFENLDVLLDRPIRLDLPSLEAKLVRARRGGYCFEQNTLFSAALGALGFQVDTLEARVRPPGARAPLPRTHMVLRVEAAGESLLADVGFGGDGSFAPVPLGGEPVDDGDGEVQVAREASGVLVLRRSRGGDRQDLYAFTLDPVLPVDYEVANHYTSTWPGSRFRQTFTVQRSTARLRHILRGPSYLRRSARGEESRAIGPQELPRLLAEVFGLELPAADIERAWRAALTPST